MTRQESAFLSETVGKWGEVMTPLASAYLSECGNAGEGPTPDGFRHFLDNMGESLSDRGDLMGPNPTGGGEDNLTLAERVLFSVEPDRTLPNRVRTETPVRDVWDGWVAFVREELGTDPDPEERERYTRLTSGSVSELLYLFSGYASDQLHDDFTPGFDAEGVPTGE